MRISLTRLILFALTGVFAAQAFFYFPNLPDMVATHFDQLGRPNDIMPKRMFLTFEFALLLLIVTETLLIPVIIERLPVRLINIPNRSYWLADERRAATFDRIRTMFEALGVIMIAFFIVVNQLVFRANIVRQNLETWMFVAAFAVFVCVLVGWLIAFVRRFRIPK